MRSFHKPSTVKRGMVDPTYAARVRTATRSAYRSRGRSPMRSCIGRCARARPPETATLNVGVAFGCYESFAKNPRKSEAGIVMGRAMKRLPRHPEKA